MATATIPRNTRRVTWKPARARRQSHTPGRMNDRR